MPDRPTLSELLPTFDEANDPRDDFRRMAEGIEIAEWAQRIQEFVEFDSIQAGGRRYSIRVNGREYEAPHVNIRIGSSVDVRIFLGHSPGEVAPDDAARPNFKQQIGNREARRLLLDFVRAHHACLLRAWEEMGNPLHSPGSEVGVTCERHPAAGPEIVQKRGGITLPRESLNAHLDEAPDS